MRWFCVAPDLPAKASLRIRAAPHSDADVCGRFSKGKAVAALSNVFEIADESGASETQRWLHVTFPEEMSGDWIEGFVMTELANGMALLVPWEDAGFYSCCTVINDRAVVYEGPEPTAPAVGIISEGEGTRFPYGVREIDSHRLRIFHDVHERVWVDAADVEFVCERLEHATCTVPHSFFTLNEELPPEAQIAVREFPSREADTRALLSRGQVVEVEMRCGSWLKIAGSPESWIMWRTDTWQLLTEVPRHSSGACVQGANDVDMESGEMPNAQLGREAEVDTARVSENHDMEMDTGSNGGTALAVDTDVPTGHGEAASTNSPNVASLCDGLASHDISSQEEDVPIDRQESPQKATSTDESSHWEDRPLHVESFAQGGRTGDQDEFQQPTEVYDDEVAVDVAAQNESSTSWEDRPISKSSGGYNWESEYPAPETTAVNGAPNSLLQDSSLQGVEAGDATNAEVAMEETADSFATPTTMEVESRKEVVESTVTTGSWEDRPIVKSNRKCNWESEYPPAEVTTVNDVPDSLPEDPIQQHVGAGDVASAQTEVEKTVDYSVSAATEMEVTEKVVEPAGTTQSWDDRPIAKSRGVYDWESEYPVPESTDASNIPDTLPHVASRPILTSENAVSAEIDGEETTDAPVPFVSTEMETAEAVVQPMAATQSWDDRPITASRGGCDWESEYPPPAETVVADLSDPVPQDLKQQVFEVDDAISAEVQAEEITELSTFTVNAIAEEVVGPTKAASSWEDRPITKSRGEYDWKLEYPLPVNTVVNNDRGSLPQSSAEQVVEAESAMREDDRDVEETADGLGSAANMETEVEEVVERSTPTRAVHSWDDRPIAKSSGGYDWESAYPPTTEESFPEEATSNTEMQDGKARNATEVDAATVPKDDPNGVSSTHEEEKEWHWEEAPIKSRHARKAAGEFKSVNSPSGEDPPGGQDAEKVSDEAKPWRVIHKKRSVQRTPPPSQAVEEQAPCAVSTTASSESSPKHPAVGIVFCEDNSVAVHSIDAAEDADAFTEFDGDANRRNEDMTVYTTVSALQNSPTPTHHAPPVVGIVSAESNSVAWHSNDSAEGPGVFEEAYTTSAVKDVAHDGQSPRVEAHGSLLDPYGSTMDDSQYDQQEQYHVDDMEVEDDESVRDEPHDDDHVSVDSSLMSNFDGQVEPFVDEHDTAFGAPIDPLDFSARLVTMLRNDSCSPSRANRILKAIALDEGSDAILEALATTGEFDEELLKYEFALPSERRQVAPSPSTSDSALLDVLYSRDQDDAFATPKKRRPPALSTTPSSPYASESKEQLLAGILRRTPQKATTSHSKIIHSANPEDILEAEFASCSDELGLFGNYQYPTVSTSQFSSGPIKTPIRTASAFGSLQSPSFASSSFSSPPPKENPLKRSAAAIAKTPPVMLPKSAAPSHPVMPPAPKPAARMPVPNPVPVSAPAKPKPSPMLTKTLSTSRLPPSVRTPTALPRPSLMAPSRLRAPSTGGPTIPSPTVNRTRSFTASNDARPTTSITTSTSAAASASRMAKTQSMLPRRSALQAPSPVKFGLTRTNSLASATVTPPAASTNANTGVDPRRLSFGFSRPSSASKKP